MRHLENPRDDGKDPVIKAYTNEILSTIREMLSLNPMFKEHVQWFLQASTLHRSRGLAGMSDGTL